MKMKLKSYLNKQVAYYVFGISILSLGIRFIVDSNLGAAPWDLLSYGLYSKIGISIGLWQIINNILMIITTKLIFKKKWNFICLIPGILQGMFIDAFAQFIHVGSYNPYVVLIVGCILSAIGLTIYMNQGLSANAIDNFTYMLHSEKGIKMGISKIICDSIPFTIVLILSINIQIATLLVYVLVPLFMQMLQLVLPKKPVYNSLNTNEF